MMPFFAQDCKCEQQPFDKILNLIFDIAQEVLGISEDILVQFREVFLKHRLESDLIVYIISNIGTERRECFL